MHSEHSSFPTRVSLNKVIDVATEFVLVLGWPEWTFLKNFFPPSLVGRMAFGVCLSSFLNVETKIFDNRLMEELFWFAL